MKKTGESSEPLLSDSTMSPSEEQLRIIRKGEKAMNFLIGQVMAKTGGRANPHIVRQMIEDRLHKESSV